MSKQENFNNLREELTYADISQITNLVCTKCKSKTRNRVKSLLTYSLSLVPFYGIFDRLIRENGEWSYCAGQSYPDEIRTLREIILKGDN